MIYPIKYSEKLNFSIISKRAVQFNCDPNATLPPFALLLHATRWKLVYNNSIFWFVFVDTSGIFDQAHRLVFFSTSVVLTDEAARAFVSQLSEDWRVHCEVDSETYHIGDLRFRATVERPANFDLLVRSWSDSRPKDSSHLGWAYCFFRQHKRSTDIF